MEKINPAEIKILVVDDDANVARGTAHLLQQAGYVTMTAVNGLEALQSIQSFQPHLVLLDRDMPGMDGMEVCRQIRQDPALTSVLVIFVSGVNISSEEQSEGLESGADGYITRPIANRELLARVEAYVRIQFLNRSLKQHVEELKQVNETARQARLASLNLMEEAVAARDQLAAANRKLQKEVTERKQAEEVIRDMARRFQEIVNQQHSGILVVSRDGVVEFANKTFCDSLGLSEQPEALHGLTSEQILKLVRLAYADPDNVIASVRAMLACNVPVFDHELQMRSGQTLLLDFVPLVIDSQAAGRMWLHRDITERKQIEQVVSESEARFRALLEQAPIAISLGRDGIILFANDKYEKLFGAQKHGEFVGRPILEKYAPPCREEIKEYHRRRSLGQPVPTEYECVGLRTDGSQFPMQVTVGKIQLQDGAAYMGFIADITERKRTELALRESEDRYRQLFELESDAVILVDCETHRYVEVNPSALRLYGYSREEFLQLTPEQVSDEPEKTRATVGTGQAFVPLRWHRRKNGERFAVEISASVIQHRGRRTELAALRDITIRQHAMEMLRETTGQLQEAQRIARLGTYNFDIKSGLWSSCEVLNEIFGIGASGFERDVAGWLQIVHPQDRAEMQRYLAEEILQKKKAFDHVYRIVRIQDQQERWVHGLGKLVLDEQGGVARMSGIIQDITESKRAELALAGERSLLRTLVDHLPLCVYLKDTAGRKTLANAEDLKNFGVASEAELLGRTDFDFFPPEQAAAFYAVDLQVMQSGQPKLQHEQKLTRPDGSHHWLLTSKVPLFDAVGQVTGLAGISLDITERKRAEEKLVRLATAVEQAAEVVVITDTAGTILYANPVFESCTGYSPMEAIGQNPRMLKSGKHDPEFYRQMWNTLKRGEVWTGRMINKRKDGTLFEEDATISPVRDASGAIVNYVAVKRNVTREVELEKQLRQAQKLEAVGQLAGGVAHDFNNLLSSQFLQISLLTLDPNLPAEVREGLEQIHKDAQRAANLVRQLLLFSRRKEMSSHDLDLNAVITDLAKLLRRTLGEQVELRLNLPPGLPLIHADPGMMEQVLLNLIVNARDAMPKGGALAIETTAAALDDSLKELFPEAVPGRYVRLRVSDTGTGIPPEILPRIFEPFFTTKEVGQGTGLGLATVFGIVKQHRGAIKVANEPGRGVAFEIFLPAISTPSGAAPASATAPRNAGSGSETILLVEDEPGLRLPLRKMLTLHGYTVLEAADGLEAVAVWRKHPGTIALLLTDLVMPGAMSGQELANQLLAEQPALKVMLMSGYSADIAGRELNLRPGMVFMQKPVAADVLLATIRRCLEG